MLFLFGTLSMNLDLCCEFQKIPNLINHYDEHNSYDGDSFWQFLVEDYLNFQGDQEHHESKEHDDLPFHGSHQCSHAPLLYTLDSRNNIPASEKPTDAANGMYSFSCISAFTDTPLQPPQA